VYLAAKDRNPTFRSVPSLRGPRVAEGADIRENLGSPFFAMVHDLHTNMMIGEGAGRTLVGWFAWA